MARKLKRLSNEEYMELWERVVNEELHLGSIADMRMATPEEDWMQATDAVISIPEGEMALRLRDWYYKEKYGPQWSIRVRTRGGGRTEIHKLRDGWARWYLFGYYYEETNTIGWWALIDLDCVRESGILNSIGDNDYVSNNDGTGGAYISFSELASRGCITESSEPIDHNLMLEF